MSSFYLGAKGADFLSESVQIMHSKSGKSYLLELIHNVTLGGWSAERENYNVCQKKGDFYI